MMSNALDPVTQNHVDKAAVALADEFAGIFSEETIRRYIGESTDLLGGASINVFVPVLAHRFARERLKALAQAQGVLVTEQPEVLFVCVHNAGRSQMAAGLVKLRSENVFDMGWQDIGGLFSNAGVCQPWGAIHLI